MYPVLFRLGPIPVHTYGLLLAVGFLLGVYLIQRDARKAGIDPDHVSNMAFWVLLLGILGARLTHIIMFPEDYSWRDPLGWFAIWRGGLVFHGAIPPAILFCYLYLRRARVPFLPMSDLVFPYLPLGHAIGRLGCFAYGCCYGKVTSLPWGIRFPRVPFDTSLPVEGSPAFYDHLHRFSGVTAADHWSLPVHPTQLYGFLGLSGLCLLLLWLRARHNPFPGFIMCAYFVLYSVGRFFMEFLRGDHNPTHFGGALTDQQIYSVVAVVGGLLLAWYLARRARHLHTPATT